MIKVDRELTPEIATIVTLAGLRGIRNYSIENDIILDDDPTSSQWQEPLKDAESLGSACAAYSIDAATGRDVLEQRGRWLSWINALSDKYGMSLAIGRLLESSTNIVINSYLSLFEGIAKSHTGQALKSVEELVLKRNQADFSLPDLYNNRLLVFSPLSTDYLLACLLNKTIQRSLSLTCFRLKPLILSRTRGWGYRPLAIPDPKDESLADITRVEVFVDNPSTDSRTIRVATEAVSIFWRNR